MSESRDTIAANEGSTEVSRAPVDDSQLIAEAVSVFLQRTADGESVSLSDFCARYRKHGEAAQAAVYRQLEVEQFLQRHASIDIVNRGPTFPVPGERIGEYEVIAEIGCGRLARVYLCDQVVPVQRQMVLKVGPPDLFEAQIVCRFQHPHIVPVYSVRQDAARRASILCMPFMGRTTLQSATRRALEYEVVDDSPSAPRRGLFETLEGASGLVADDYLGQVVRLGAKIAAALEYAHQRGVLHGDVKPSNVLMATSGEPLLMDFNLSGDRQQSVLPSGGTLGYMAPEQLRYLLSAGQEDALQYSERSDLFSLGVILFELLAGRRPFPVGDATEYGQEHVKESAAAILERQQDGPSSLQRCNPLVNSGLARIVQQLLAFDPAGRIASAGEVAALLNAQLTPTARVSRRIRRRRKALKRTAALLMASAAVVGAWRLSLPPRHLRMFDRAVAAFDRNDAVAAEEWLRKSIAASNKFLPAKFELAKLHLKRREWLEARILFTDVKKALDDPVSKAYLGCCSALSQEHGGAIYWYDQVLGSGRAIARRGAVLNNAAVSYLFGQSSTSEEE
ncbi:MAG: serine/threonine-protein kinase, partial [Planctomycetota bacterium]